jgi:hypothetical protein
MFYPNTGAIEVERPTLIGHNQLKRFLSGNPRLNLA